ncbi:hypothetical protein [Halomonas ramblicola]|uniref:RraA family protein n=1 Tax=Halomonas ramblicola TaxID=747349 RepID=UPI00338F3D28
MEISNYGRYRRLVRHACSHVTSSTLQFQQFGAITGFAGHIRTVRCVNDNMLIKKTLQEDADGEVLIVDAGGY